MDGVRTLQLQLGDLLSLRAQHVAEGKLHFLSYIDQLIANVEAQIALTEPPASDAP